MESRKLLKQCLAGMLVFAGVAPLRAQDVDLSKLTERARPAPELRALDPLVGRWRVDKKVSVAMGTPDRPARSSAMTTTRTWENDGKFLRSVTTGKLGPQPYRRVGYLGYNPMDRRYEWNTVDNVTTTMMTYHGADGSGSRRPIEMTGAFTDMGVTGEADVGKPVSMRTVITISDRDHHRFDIYFTPPGGPEIHADQMDFTRIKAR